ncbi:hypothetical protein M8C21_008349 [Ambrosia artemisiifolia]|uniref:Uncharacterized protein n=1 Tax=Ambrosia artemisiifolia TaxID=4212 RepID=A0AAD5BSM8_AMBAR|nr:hypothetical protein M8C21_008349 [Ambrosia artemisiifolia]
MHCCNGFFRSLGVESKLHKHRMDSTLGHQTLPMSKYWIP